MIWFVGVVVLLVAGILVVRRRASGRAAHLLYAVISIVGTLVYAVSAVIKSQAISAWIAHNPTDPYLKQPAAHFGASAVFPVITAIVCLVYPVFIVLLVWPNGKTPLRSGPGRRSRWCERRARSDVYLGLDIGGTKLGVCVGTPDGRVLASERIANDRGSTPERLLGECKERLAALAAKAGLRRVLASCGRVPGAAGLQGREVHQPSEQSWRGTALRYGTG